MSDLNGLPLSTVAFYEKLLEVNPPSAARYLRYKQKPVKGQRSDREGYEKPEEKLSLEDCKRLVKYMVEDYKSNPRNGFLTMEVFCWRSGWAMRPMRRNYPGLWDEIKAQFRAVAPYK